MLELHYTNRWHMRSYPTVTEPFDRTRNGIHKKCDTRKRGMTSSRHGSDTVL